MENCSIPGKWKYFSKVAQSAFSQPSEELCQLSLVGTSLFLKQIHLIVASKIKTCMFCFTVAHLLANHPNDIFISAKIV